MSSAAVCRTASGKVSANQTQRPRTNGLCNFVGWYSDASLSTAWDFDTDAVTADLTLTASWRQLSIDAGVSSVTVSGTAAARKDQRYGYYRHPARRSSLPADADEITIEVAAGATYGDTLTTSDGGATWTFTVTAEDGTTAERIPSILPSNSPARA